MNDNVTFRKVYERDLPALVEMEALAHLWDDPDFGLRCVSPHAWTAADITAVLEEEDTRCWVVDEVDGNIIAYLVYEIEDDAYRVRRLLVHPDYRNCDVGRTVLARLYQKIVKSESRKTLRVRVREDDVPTCRWLARMKFASRLVRGGWNADLDGVEFTFTTTEHAEKETPHLH